MASPPMNARKPDPPSVSGKDEEEEGKKRERAAARQRKSRAKKKAKEAAAAEAATRASTPAQAPALAYASTPARTTSSNNNNIKNNWTRGILVKVETPTTTTWKVMNATKTTKLRTISWDGDHGLEANWGLWYKDPFDDVETTCIAAAAKK